MKKLLILVFSVFVFFGLSGCGNSSNNPEKVAVSFFQNLIDGKTDLAVEMLDFSSLKDDEVKIAKDKLKVLLGSFGEELKKNGKDVKISSKGVTYSEDKNRATVTLEIATKEDTKTDEVELVKVNKEWKIVLQ